MTENNLSAFEFALESGNLKLFKLLWEDSEDFTQEEKEKILLKAIKNSNDLSFVKALFAEGFFPVDYVAKGGGNLTHFASGSDNVELLKFLVKKGLDFKAKDDQGITPIMVCAMGSSPEMLKTLLSLGADKDELTNHGETLLNLAARLNPNPEMIDCLVDLGFDINRPDDMGFTPFLDAISSQPNNDVIHNLLKYKADYNARTKSGEGAFQLCSLNPNPEIVRDVGSVFTTDEVYDTEFTSIEYALLHSDKPDNIKIYLKNEKVEHLLAACYNPNVAAMATLIEEGYDPNWTYADEETVLMFAARVSSNVELMEMLLSVGADPKAVDATGKNFVHYAASNEETVIYEWIKEQDAFKELCEALDDDGKNPAFYSSHKDLF